MATKKEGGKNKKIGRHSRNPSSQHQAKRTERNKDKRAQRLVHNPSKTNRHMLHGVSKQGRMLWGTVEFRGVRIRVYCI